MLVGYTFNGKKYPAEDFAEFQKAMLNNSYGIFKGFELSNTDNTITIEKGLAVLNGRTVANLGSETIEIEELQTGELFCNLILEINLSIESIENDTIVSFKILSNASNYSNLVQEDINESGEIFQFELARFKNTATGINDFEDTRTFINFEGIYTEVRNAINNIKDKSALVFKQDMLPKNIQINFNNNFILNKKDCCVIGNEVYITIIGRFKSTQINQYMEIGTIEENYRPPLDIYFVAPKEGMASIVDALIDTNGIVKLYNTGQNPVGQIDANKEVRIHTNYAIGLRQGSITSSILN